MICHVIITPIGIPGSITLPIPSEVKIINKIVIITGFGSIKSEFSTNYSSWGCNVKFCHGSIIKFAVNYCSVFLSDIVSYILRCKNHIEKEWSLFVIISKKLEYKGNSLEYIRDSCKIVRCCNKLIILP